MKSFVDIQLHFNSIIIGRTSDTEGGFKLHLSLST